MRSIYLTIGGKKPSNPALNIEGLFGLEPIYSLSPREQETVTRPHDLILVIIWAR